MHDTLGEAVLYDIVKAVEEVGYNIGNKTKLMLKVIQKAEVVIDKRTRLVVGSESESTLGRIAFKATQDLSRG